MTYENFVKAQLVTFAVREGARHGGKNNMFAVAQVIANRVRAGWGGGDWLEVLDTAPSFAGTVYPDDTRLNPRDPTFRIMLQKVDDVYHNQVSEDFTLGALYYAELHNVNRDWFTTQILGNLGSHPRLSSVGPVTFFG